MIVYDFCFFMTDILSNKTSLDFFARALKTARLEKMLSLDDVSHLTKIQKHYLENIEDNNFTFLPNSYVYAYLKTYGKELKIGDSETLELCRKELQILSGVTTKEIVDGSFSGDRKERKYGRLIAPNVQFLKAMLPLSIGMFVGVIGAVGYSYFEENTRVSVTPLPSLPQHLDSAIVKKGAIQKKYFLRSPLRPKSSPEPFVLSSSAVSPEPQALSASQK